MKTLEPDALPWNADLYESQHNFVFDLARDLVVLLDPKPGEKILDVGCGTGQLTELIREKMIQHHNGIAERVMGGGGFRQVVGRNESINAMPNPPLGSTTSGTLVGIDPSETMIANAQGNYPNISFRVMNVTAMPFENEFDAVFSNAVLHWVPNADLAAKNIANSLKPGGRLVAEFGGKGNVSSLVEATIEALKAEGVEDAHPVWFYPSVGEYTPILEKHGIEVRHAALFDRPTKLQGENGLLDWLRMFGAGFAGTATEEQRARAYQRVVDKLKDTHYRDNSWWADYRRLRIIAVKA